MLSSDIVEELVERFLDHETRVTAKRNTKSITECSLPNLHAALGVDVVIA